MSATSALEGNEDLENVTLVRMEDVQPDRNSDVYEVLQMSPCVINSVIDHDYSCVVKDEDSNIGSMVSINPEEVEDCSENTEIVDQINTYAIPNQDSWPTLEISPGGVIKHLEKMMPNINQNGANETDERNMMYACAKCPQRFKYLFSLVKHVKWHEDLQKRQKMSISSITHSMIIQKSYVPMKKKKVVKYKTKCKIPKKR